jgi:DNA-3-methyladenine glycosylase I
MTNPPPTNYCEALHFMKPEDLAMHKKYHDEQYGFPIDNDNELFCRLILEINQAGLSWTTILKKQATFRKAYKNFNIKKVAAFTPADIERLLNDPGIIRNKLKVNAAVNNAKVILQLQKEHGSFKNWLHHHHPKDRAAWTVLFKKTFTFTGGEIVHEFLLSIGFLPGAHHPNCAIYKNAMAANPLWLNS